MWCDSLFWPRHVGVRIGNKVRKGLTLKYNIKKGLNKKNPGGARWRDALVADRGGVGGGDVTGVTTRGRKNGEALGWNAPLGGENGTAGRLKRQGGGICQIGKVLNSNRKSFKKFEIPDFWGYFSCGLMV